jgi:hypothetical protein
MSKLTLVKNKKLDCIYHKESMLVFKSPSEKIVIGRIENDQIISLDEKTLELCEQYGFTYDESLLEEAEETEDNNSAEAPAQEQSETQQPVQPSQPVQPTTQPVQATTQPVQATTQPVQPKLESFLKEFEGIVNMHTLHIVDCYKSQIEVFSDTLQKSNDRVSELEGQLTTLRKELDDTKKKMKGILAAIQADL